MGDERSVTHEGSGPLIKVTEVTDDRRGIFGVWKNGEYASLTSNYETEVRPGDVAIVSPHGFVVVPEAVWPGDNQLAEVLKVDDNELVLDAGYLKPRLFERPGNFSVDVGNTVEFNDLDGVLRVVDSESLIKRAREGPDVDPSVFRKKRDPNRPLSFDDFGGYPHIVARAREFVETPLKRKAELDAINARPVRGVLFTGAPGTGKTHLARIIAQVSAAEFYLVNGPELVTKYVGDSESILRRLFHRASSHERAIIFFDEIDSIASKRDANSHEASNRLVTQFLTEMDGYDSTDNVIVIGATNRASELDRALRRPGRFDWEIEFGLPNLQDRLEILTLKAASYSSTGDLNLEVLATLTPGWSGADIDLLLKDAALVAAIERRRSIRQEDLMMAVERLKNRPQHKTEVETQE